MRLSDAIKLGSMLKPQGFDSLQTFGGGSCALGAALDAIGVEAGLQNLLTDVELAALLPVINTAATCPQQPCPSEFPIEIGSVITHLNDDHHWTREQIADWVATVEPPDVPAPAMEPPSSRFLAVDPADGIVALVHAR